MIGKYIEQDFNLYGYTIKKIYLKSRIVKGIIKDMRLEKYNKKEILHLLKDDMRIEMFAYSKFRAELNDVLNCDINEKQIKCIFEIFEEDKSIFFEDFCLLVNMYFDDSIEEALLFKWFKIFNDSNVKKEHIELL